MSATEEGNMVVFCGAGIMGRGRRRQIARAED
jgi:hypothetical protein